MQWMHKCKLEWLQARQDCLTASDIKDLLPVTRTGRKRTIDNESYIRVLAKKRMMLTKQDCVSYGAAARGHILEPYAIGLYNEQYADIPLDHWDDIVVTRRVHEPMALAFSPDSANVKCDGLPVIGHVDGIFRIGEVKCYSPEHHMACGYTDKDKLEERWQIATAMAVLDSIEEASLIFYNPSMQDQMYIVEYVRKDLADEIELVLETECKWLEWLDEFNKLARHYLVTGTGNAEQLIIRDIVKREQLNPEGERSVIL